MSASGKKMQLQGLVEFWETAGDMSCIYLERGYCASNDPDFCWIATIDITRNGGLKNKVGCPIIRCLCGRYVQTSRKPDKKCLLKKFVCPCCDLSVDFRLGGWNDMFIKSKREQAGKEEY